MCVYLHVDNVYMVTKIGVKMKNPSVALAICNSLEYHFHKDLFWLIQAYLIRASNIVIQSKDFKIDCYGIMLEIRERKQDN